MSFMQLYSSLFLTATVILGITTVVCAVIAVVIVLKHNSYKRELELEVTLRKELEAQLAVSLEVENFYFVLFLDLINTQDPTEAAYKATMLRTTVDLLTADGSLIDKVKKAMLRPGGTKSVLTSIVEPNLPVLANDTRNAYDKLILNLTELDAICESAQKNSEDAYNNLGITPNLAHIPQSVRTVGRRNVEELIRDNNVRLVYDAETAAILNSLKKQSDAANMDQSEETDT